MGPNIIENDIEDAAPQLSERVREKEKRYDRPENSNVIRDKTYSLPIGRGNTQVPHKKFHPTITQSGQSLQGVNPGDE